LWTNPLQNPLIKKIEFFIINLTLFIYNVKLTTIFISFIYFLSVYLYSHVVGTCVSGQVNCGADPSRFPIPEPRSPVPAALALQLQSNWANCLRVELTKAQSTSFSLFSFSLAVLRLICKFPIMKQHKHVCVWQPQKRGLREEGRGTLSPCGVSCVAPLFRPLSAEKRKKPRQQTNKLKDKQPKGKA